MSSDAQTPPPPAPVEKRSIIYIDGFNFYYGMLAGRPDLKWINYQRSGELLRPDNDIVHVRLFTAMVDRKKTVSGKRDRHQRLWTALKTQPKMTITEGKFADRERTCLVPTCYNPQRKYVALEEKQTDVNIALQLVRDVQTLAPDYVVVISGDIDLLPALDVVLAIDKKVRPVIYIPVHEETLKYRRKDEFMKYSQTVKPIPEKYLRQAQFPPQFPLANGTVVERPAEWPVA
jgi:6-hydroxy-3-succinoylpyridine 3-monooxygenase